MVQPFRKTMVITGASTGIGAACASHFASQGWRVYAGVRREEDGARLTQSASDNLVPLMLDVESEGSVRTAVDTVTTANQMS